MPHEKLALMRGCCEHAEEYCAGNKTFFWAMQTGYDPFQAHQTVTRWVRSELDELIDEVGTALRTEKDAFKTAVEQFTD